MAAMSPPVSRVDAVSDAALGAVVMAAGAGRRMGGRPKCLLQRDGVSLLARTVQALVAAGVREVAVVLGHHAARVNVELDAIEAALPRGVRLHHALNPSPDDGPGSSLRCGLAALPGNLDAVVVSLADQPLTTAEDVATMVIAWQSRAAGTSLLVPQFEGQPGHPLIFDTDVRAAVAGMASAAGLREWRRAHPSRVAFLPASHAHYTRDIDSEADLADLQRDAGVALVWHGDLAKVSSAAD